MERLSCRLTIFEGPDGSGKSTAAKQFADLTGARYVHFGPLPNVTNGLSRMYVEAMLPALLGYQDVVFDRSWLSELPYGVAFRNDKVRVNSADCRMLERLAMRCGGVVVQCCPPWETVKANYLGRRNIEMLENEDQLKLVYEIYDNQPTMLPTLGYDYTRGGCPFNSHDSAAFVDELRMPLHQLKFNTAGNLEASTVVVVGPNCERGDQDPWYQGPFITFEKDTFEQLVLRQLGPEQTHLWVSTSDIDILGQLNPRTIVAIGVEACHELSLYAAQLHAATSMATGELRRGPVTIPMVRYSLDNSFN